jgi:hypothetical protein
MKKRLATILSIGSATAAMLVLAAAPAPAATATWTVSPGGSWTGTLSSGAAFVIQDGVTGTTVTCASGTIGGTFSAGTGLSADLGTVTSMSPGTCTGPDGSTYTVTANASSAHPWIVGAQAYGDGESSGEFASANGTGVGFTLTGPGCTVVLGGTATLSGYLIYDYDNSGGILAFQHSTYRPVIRVASTTCSSWLATDGMRVYITPAFPAGGFALSPIQTITSP